MALLDRTLVPIRERSFLDLLDLSLVVIRRRPLALGVAAAVGFVPFLALNAYLKATYREMPPLVLLLLLGWEAPWATAPLTVVLGGLMFGERPTAVKVARALLVGFVPMFLYQGLLRGLLLGFSVLSFLIPSRFGFLNEVILLERGAWRMPAARSRALSSNREGELFFRGVIQIGFGALFALAFWHAFGALWTLLVGSWSWDELTWPGFFEWPTQLGIWLAISQMAVVRFLTYLDQRIRLEGWEVELRLRQVGAAMEDTERW